MACERVHKQNEPKLSNMISLPNSIKHQFSCVEQKQNEVRRNHSNGKLFDLFTFDWFPIIRSDKRQIFNYAFEKIREKYANAIIIESI